MEMGQKAAGGEANSPAAKVSARVPSLFGTGLRSTGLTGFLVFHEAERAWSTAIQGELLTRP